MMTFLGKPAFPQYPIRFNFEITFFRTRALLGEPPPYRT